MANADEFRSPTNIRNKHMTNGNVKTLFPKKNAPNAIKPTAVNNRPTFAVDNIDNNS